MKAVVDSDEIIILSFNVFQMKKAKHGEGNCGSSRQDILVRDLPVDPASSRGTACTSSALLFYRVPLNCFGGKKR